MAWFTWNPDTKQFGIDREACERFCREAVCYLNKDLFFDGADPLDSERRRASLQSVLGIKVEFR